MTYDDVNRWISKVQDTSARQQTVTDDQARELALITEKTTPPGAYRSVDLLRILWAARRALAPVRF